jgi:alpha-mannosidase
LKKYLLSFLTFICINSFAQKRIYIANDDHTDYMWTADETKYDSAFVHMLDYYLHHIDSTKNNPSDFQARFNCDGSFWLSAYQKYRSPDQYQRLINAIRSGHISSPLTTVVSTYGAQPTEAVIRGMYFAGHQERRWGLRFPMAVAMENQTLPLGLSSLWAGSGAKYSWKGVCACATRMGPHWAHRKHQLYNYTGLDQSSVLMKWYNMTANNASLGGYAETRLAYKPISVDSSLSHTIDTLTSLCDNRSYPYQAAAAFGWGWDDYQTYVSPHFVKAAQKGSNANRKVRVSNEIDFFEDIKKTYPNLPTESVSYGNEWDTYCASLNETTAKVRRAIEKLRTAEALASIVSLRDKHFAQDLIPARNAAWEGYGLYWEHNWTSDGPISKKDRAVWQKKIQNNITTYSDALLELSKKALGQQIKKSRLDRFYVFNPLSWSRDDAADIDYEGDQNIAVVDLNTNQEVPYQFVNKNSKPYLRIWAKEIPSVGYKVFEIRKVQSKIAIAKSFFDGEYIENDFYKIKFHKSGIISELVDKKTNRNIIKAIDGKYVNDLGSKDVNSGEAITIESEGPVSTTWKAVSFDPILHTAKLTLYKNSPRIEIGDSIQANFGDLKTWAFSFDLKNQLTTHEELGAVLTVNKNDKGGHYATQNARYDWLTFNHFVDMSEPNFGVTLSNQDCSFFKLGQSTPDSLWHHSSQINALAGGQTDGEKLGIVNQDGNQDFLYHFALTTHHGAPNSVAAMKFSLEHQNPLQSGWVEGKQGTKSTSYSLLSIPNPEVLLWSIKPSEEGIANGLIARFWNMSNKPQSSIIKLSEPIKSLWETSHIETNEEKLLPIKRALKVEFRPFQMKTFRVGVR